jgi:hypothetical protein
MCIRLAQEAEVFQASGANRVLDEAQAKSELNAPALSKADSLAKKYGAADADIEAELSRLKNG